MPTPSKGDRRLVTTRIPVAYFDKLTRYCQITGTSKSDFLGDVLIKALDEVDLSALEHARNQEKLPVAA